MVEDEEAAFKQPIKDAFDEQADPYYATARLWDDGIIAPSETRRVLALAYSAALNAPVEGTSSGCSGCEGCARPIQVGN